MKSSKSKILLIGDTPGWAFDHIIDFVITQLREDYDFYYDFTVYNPRKQASETSDSVQFANPSVLNEHYKKDYSIYRIPLLRGLGYRIFKYLNYKGSRKRDAEGKKRRIRKDNSYDCVVFLDFYMSIDGDFDHVITKKTVKGIYTDGFPPRGIVLENLTVESFIDQYLSNCDALLTGANSIASIYNGKYPSPIFTANMAYDEKVFDQRKKSTSEDNTLILGWTGNPSRPFKGYYDIVEPAIDELRDEGYSLELKTQFSGTLNSLADFWNTVDLALITSEADAGPSLFMEASLCGKPSISTRIGMPNEVIIDGENGLFIERSKEDLKQKIIQLYQDRKLLKSLSENIRKDYLVQLGIEKQTTNWKLLFSKVVR